MTCFFGPLSRSVAQFSLSCSLIWELGKSQTLIGRSLAIIGNSRIGHYDKKNCEITDTTIISRNFLIDRHFWSPVMGEPSRAEKMACACPLFHKIYYLNFLFRTFFFPAIVFSTGFEVLRLSWRTHTFLQLLMLRSDCLEAITKESSELILGCLLRQSLTSGQWSCFIPGQCQLTYLMSFGLCSIWSVTPSTMLLPVSFAVMWRRITSMWSTSSSASYLGFCQQ